MGTASKEETILPRKLAKTLILQDCLSSSAAAIFLMFSFLLDVVVRVVFKVSILRPKNVTLRVGTNTDLLLVIPVTRILWQVYYQNYQTFLKCLGQQ